MTTGTTTAETTTEPPRRRWRPALGLRLRLLGWALALLAMASAVSVVVIRQVLNNQLENRIATDMRQEVTEFRRLIGARETGPAGGAELKAIADTYLLRNEPHRDELVLLYLDGRFYRATGDHAEGIGTDPALLARWTALTGSQEGVLAVTPAGPAHWLAAPVLIDGKVRGHFVVLEFVAGREEDVDRAVVLMGLSCLLVIVVVAAGGYLAMGRALRPLRTVTETARVIEETDLSRRIEVSGTDEVADLAHTFNTMLGRLQRAFHAQQAFVSDAGHELRTPITIVRGHLELMGDSPAERQETIALVTDELDRMNRMVNDLLVLAKAEQPDFLRPEPTDVTLLMGEVFAKAVALGERDWRLTAIEPAQVLGDRHRLTQAVMQLTQNAVQFTVEGGRIELAVQVQGPWVRLMVADDGIGVEPQDRERIFQRFARAESARASAEGSGLGLAIVAAIAHAHGGQVTLDSVPGAGSTFTLLLPRLGGRP